MVVFDAKLFVGGIAMGDTFDFGARTVLNGRGTVRTDVNFLYTVAVCCHSRTYSAAYGLLWLGREIQLL